jgi:hypothetical protein
MEKIYKLFIDFLVKYYTGLIQFSIGTKKYTGVKPYLGIFILIWGLFKLFFQAMPFDEVWWAWWDYIMLILLIPQVVAGFSKFAINEQKRLNAKNEK